MRIIGEYARNFMSLFRGIGKVMNVHSDTSKVPNPLFRHMIIHNPGACTVRGKSMPLWGNIGVFILGGCFLLSSSLSFAADQPQELPKPDLKATPPVFQEWNFESSSTDTLPDGFHIFSGGGASTEGWAVHEDSSAPSRSHVVRQSLACQNPDCYQLFVADNIQVDYVDISVRLKMLLGSPSGYAGLAFGIQDAKNFYATVVHPESNHVVVYAVKEGVPTEIAKAELIPNDIPWHFLRIQRYTIVSKEVIEVFFDHHMLLSFWDGSFRVGKIGLVAMGNTGFAFDNLRAMELLTQRPFSRPSAY